MIYPTRPAILIMAAGVPASLIAGVLTDAGWLLGPAWVLSLVLLVAADAALAGSRAALEASSTGPVDAAIGRAGRLDLQLRFLRGRTPGRVQAAVGGDPRLGLAAAPTTAPVEDRAATLGFDFLPTRRGPATVEGLWVRWQGPMRLAWKQKDFRLDLPAPVLTDLRGVRDQAIRLFARDALFGSKSQLQVGEGAEFQAMRDFQPGMYRRGIDWKSSARHGQLLSKEFRTERNHNIVLALDCGRAGSEPVAGQPRIDRFIQAALLLAYACLRSGDRVGLRAFDSRPRLSTATVAGVNAFRLLQHTAGRIDYSTHETNFTLALATLSGELQRRSLIVVFTEFTDPTSAELMIDAAARLLKRHLLLFVVLRDEELESQVEAEPAEPDDVSRSVVAGTLLRERDTVVARLRRMGVHVVEATTVTVGPDVINAYLGLKRSNLL